MHLTHAPTKQHLICGLSEHDPCFHRTIIRLHPRCGSVSERGRANTLSTSTTSTLESLPRSHISKGRTTLHLFSTFMTSAAQTNALSLSRLTNTLPLSFSPTSDQTPFCVGRWSQNCISSHPRDGRPQHPWDIADLPCGGTCAHPRCMLCSSLVNTPKKCHITPCTPHTPLALASSRPVNHLVSFTRCDAHADLRGQFVDPVIRLKHSAQHNKKPCFANTEKACISFARFLV